MRCPEGMIVLNAALFHVDVFATATLTGNGLTAFLDSGGWSHSVMQRLTREVKQFESIFLSDISPAGATGSIITESCAIATGRCLAERCSSREYRGREARRWHRC
jgi:hypothetical protein